MGELDALYVQHGVEHTLDDVSGAWLDPVLVREGRDVEMAFFERHWSLRACAEVLTDPNRRGNHRHEVDRREQGGL